MLKQDKIQHNGTTGKFLILVVGLLISSISFAQSGISSILLTTPFNEQEIEVKYPLFSWSSPITFKSMSEVTYYFRIVEVFSYQSAVSAVLGNPSLYEKEVGSATILQYPVDAPELQDCKKYAWQVIAYDKKHRIIDELNYKSTYINKIAQSEPYIFQTACRNNNRISNPSSVHPYIVLKKTVDNYVFKIDADKKLNIKYVEEYADDSLSYKIYNWKREIVASNLVYEVPLDYGWNYLTIDLSGISPSVLPVGVENIYQLEIQTPKGDIYKAKFEITQ